MTVLMRGSNDISDDVRRKVAAEIAHNGLLAHLSSDRVQTEIEKKPILADGARADARLLGAILRGD